MPPLRRLLRHPALAALVVAAALALRLLVPAGYMPVIDGGRVILAPCPGTAPAPSQARAHAHGGTAHAGHEAPPPAPDKGCAFADLALPAIGGADPIQIAALIAFLVATALVLQALPPRAPVRRLHPPAQGPPILA